MSTYKRQGPLDSWGAKAEIKQFLYLYRDVADSKALKNPEVKQVIKNLASQISEGADLVSELTEDVYDRKLNLADAPRTKVSRATNIKSMTICNTGGGRDKGDRCH